MDSLARNAMLARQAGMTYGQWKSMQKPVKIVKKIPEGWKRCKGCDVVFKPRNSKQRYCDIICRDTHWRETNKEKIRMKSKILRERRKAMAVE